MCYKCVNVNDPTSCVKSQICNKNQVVFNLQCIYFSIIHVRAFNTRILLFIIVYTSIGRGTPLNFYYFLLQGRIDLVKTLHPPKKNVELSKNGFKCLHVRVLNYGDETSYT